MSLPFGLRTSHRATLVLTTSSVDSAYAKAFTLVELLLVITIIGILAALVVPQFRGRTQTAKITAARQTIIGTFGVALDLFEQDMGRYPTSDEGLQALIRLENQSSGQGKSSYQGPYLKSATVPTDPWDREYHYTYPSTLTDVAGLYDLVSAGPDGQYGNEDDITNHNADTGPARDSGSRTGSRRNSN